MRRWTSKHSVEIKIGILEAGEGFSHIIIHCYLCILSLIACSNTINVNLYTLRHILYHPKENLFSSKICPAVPPPMRSTSSWPMRSLYYSDSCFLFLLSRQASLFHTLLFAYGSSQHTSPTLQSLTVLK